MTPRPSIIIALAVAALCLIRNAGTYLAAPTALPDHADAITVHGGALERIDYGAALYRQRIAPEVWYTGDSPEYREHIDKARERAEQCGIPPAHCTCSPQPAHGKMGTRLRTWPSSAASSGCSS